jgi:calcineurin-like phosphoesterase family protein
MSKNYITADPHHGHKNIIKLCNRPFANIQENDDKIINNLNEMVSDNDTLYHLGDFSYKSGLNHVIDCIERYNGFIRIILGNHDKGIKSCYKQGLLTKFIKSGKLEIIGGEEAVCNNLDISYSAQIYDRMFYLSHYSHRTWPGAFRGVIHLFGHSHSNLSPFYKSMDIGVDTNNFYPYDFKNIIHHMDSIVEDFKEN